MPALTVEQEQSRLLSAHEIAVKPSRPLLNEVVMERTEEPAEIAPRLPVAYSQGYAYVSVIQDPKLGVATSMASETAQLLTSPNEKTRVAAFLAPPLAVMALAALLSSMMDPGVFAHLQSV